MKKRSPNQRNVKRQNSQLNVNRQISSKSDSRATLKKVPAIANKTKTRRYLLYAFGCLVLMQLIKFVVYNYVFTGAETPSGLPFLIVIYTQLGLMIAALGFVITASISYLHRISQ